MPNKKTFKNGDRIVARATHVTSLAECTHRYGRKNKSKTIHGKMLPLYNKKTSTGRNSQHVCALFDLGGCSTKVAHLNIRSIQVAPEEESEAVEGQSMAVAEEQVPPNPTVDDGGTDAVAFLAEDDAILVATDASETADTVLHTVQTLLDDMDINDNINKVENAIGGSDTAPNTTETNDTTTTKLEDIVNPNPPAETSVQESSPVTQTTPINDVGVDVGEVDIVHGCEWYKYDNVDHIPLNGKLPKKKWGIWLHSGEVLYQNSDFQHVYFPLDYFLMSFPNEQIDICLIETNKQLQEWRKRETNVTELYKLFGIIILITRFETTSRARLWSTFTE